MIKLFGQTDRDFSSNGDVVLRPLKARVRKEIEKNSIGDYYLDLEVGTEYAEYMTEGRLIMVDLPQGAQAFRVNNPSITPSKVSARCWHVFYDTENYLIADSNVVNKNCNDALNHLNNATEPTSEFTISSNVSTVDSYRCVRESLYKAIETILERWGGYLVRDNFDIKVLSSISADYGETVEYRKNLQNITRDENWDDVCTKILPVGQNGILLNAVNPSASIYLTADVQYDLPYTKTVSFSQDLEEEDYPDETAFKTALVNDLERQATNYLNIHKYPEVSYTIKANPKHLVDVGDIIQVRDERLGVDLLTQVTSFEYDCILEKYREVNFGTIMKKLADLRDVITAQVIRTIGG